MSLFGADVIPPRPDDLAGLLVGAGRMVLDGETAAVSVLVDHPWRAAALVTECARRGIAATCLATTQDRISVRTAHSPLLVPLARAWSVGAEASAGAGTGETPRVPRDLVLDGQMLRLWVEAEGRRGVGSYILPVGVGDEVDRDCIGAALAAAGVPAQLAVARQGGGASYRIVGKRRLLRLLELVGDPPKQAPAGSWPS